MFYPVEILKRGGTFYICWLGDSWPLRFAALSRRQIASQNICKICDDLMEMVTKESGYVSARFSLRLSSQLMRGLVRLYQKKTAMMIEDLCMLNATISKHINKKYGSDDSPQRAPRTPQANAGRGAKVQIHELPENEERVEERIEKSNNVVANIAEITLKETAIPEIQIPLDGFGEENPEQALALFKDRTLEEMLGVSDVTQMQHSAVDLLVDVTDKSDRSRLMVEGARAMERVSEHDTSLFRKSTAADQLQFEDVEKDIPQIPDIPIPELPLPHPEKQLFVRLERLSEQELTRALRATEPEKPVELELEELEETDSEPRKRKRPKKLIIDHKIKISGNVLRARTENIALELRCEDSADDIADALRIPADHYFKRPAAVGSRLRSNISYKLARLFKRNLGVVGTPANDQEIEIMLANRHGKSGDDEEATRIQAQSKEIPQQVAVNIEQMDISELPTQILMTASQELVAGKRSAQVAELQDMAAKRPHSRPASKSFKSSQPLEEQTAEEQSNILAEQEKAKRRSPKQLRSSKKDNVDKEIPIPQDQIPIIQETIPQEIRESQFYDQPMVEERRVSQMLEAVGLADAEAKGAPKASERKSRVTGSDDSSETQLGSLDRTQVDLGDSNETTDTQKFLNKEWGTQGTMMKVMELIWRDVRPVTFDVLLENGPMMWGQQSVIAARCFTSLLRLKQHQFIRLEKDDAMKIRSISLGPKMLPYRQRVPDKCDEENEETVRMQASTKEIPQPGAVNIEQMNIAELPTQILRTASQELVAGKRSAEVAELQDVAAKRPRGSCYKSFKSSQQFADETAEEQPINQIITLQETVPQEMRESQFYNPPIIEERRVSEMLEAVGLADAEAQGVQARGEDSDDSSETQLGSLDRTQVDLGDSNETTDIQTILNEEWGTQGTMMNVMELIWRGVQPVTLEVLLENGPMMWGQQSVIAARCFTSLLKLKQHQFICLEKDDSMKIINISLGPKMKFK